MELLLLLQSQQNVVARLRNDDDAESFGADDGPADAGADAVGADDEAARRCLSLDADAGYVAGGCSAGGGDVASFDGEDADVGCSVGQR